MLSHLKMNILSKVWRKPASAFALPNLKISKIRKLLVTAFIASRLATAVKDNIQDPSLCFQRRTDIERKCEFQLLDPIPLWSLPVLRYAQFGNEQPASASIKLLNQTIFIQMRGKCLENLWQIIWKWNIWGWIKQKCMPWKSQTTETNQNGHFLSDPGIHGVWSMGLESRLLIVITRCFWDLTDMTLADEDTSSIQIDDANRAMWQCKWRYFVAKFRTNANCATWLQKSDPMAVAPSGSEFKTT